MKIQNFLKMGLPVLLMGLVVSVSHADPVTVVFEAEQDIVNGVNFGGLGLPGVSVTDTNMDREIANGDDLFNLGFQVMGNGATFDVVATLSGSTNNFIGGGDAEIQVENTGAVDFIGSGTRDLFISLTSFNEVTNTNQALTFKGISGFVLEGSGIGANLDIQGPNDSGSTPPNVPNTTATSADDLRFDADPAVFNTAAAEQLTFGNLITFDPLLNSSGDVQVRRLNSNFRVDSVQLHFEVGAANVPEPSSVALIGLLGSCLVARRRRS